MTDEITNLRSLCVDTFGAEEGPGNTVRIFHMVSTDRTPPHQFRPVAYTELTIERAGCFMAELGGVIARMIQRESEHE